MFFKQTVIQTEKQSTYHALLYIDSNPEQKKENSETHEHRCNKSHQQLLEYVTSEFCRRHFVSEVSLVKRKFSIMSICTANVQTTLFTNYS